MITEILVVAGFIAIVGFTPVIALGFLMWVAHKFICLTNLHSR